MSHINKIETVINWLDALWEACHLIPGLNEKIGQKTHRWYGSFVGDTRPNMSKQEIQTFGKCEHAIEVAGSDYDIGVYKNADGNGYYLAFDHYSSTGGKVIEQKLGVGLEKLRQMYAVCAARATAKRHGHTTSTKPTVDGKMVVTVGIH